MIKEWEELNAKATPGPWYSDSMQNPDGYALAWLWNIYIDTHAPKENGSRYRDTKDDADLIVFLRNNSEALLSLVKAAQKHVVKRSLDDDHPLRDALAKLEGK